MEKMKYIKPSLRLIPTTVENIVCGSPQAGGLEDIGYDDWDNN